MPVLGGLASASFAGGAVLLQDGEVHTDGAVAVRMRGLEVLPCVSQGAGPVGPEMTITRAEANVIGELAGKPAMERLGEVIAALPGERARAGLLRSPDRTGHRREPARIRAGRFPGPPDHRRRPRVGGDRDRRAGSGRPDRPAPGPGRRLGRRGPARGRSARRHRPSARTAPPAPCSSPATAAAPTCSRCPTTTPAAIEDSLGAPTAGFFCAGEIGPVGGRNFLHGFTATMAVFPA